MASETATGKTILIGPTHCEYGWALQFAARARARARAYDQAIAYCEEPMAYLFKDFASVQTYPQKKGKRDRWLYKGHQIELAWKETWWNRDPRPREYKVYSPNEKHCIADPPEFYKYGWHIPWDEAYLYLIHARTVNNKDWIDRKAGGTRNYPLDLYARMVKELEGPIASIGSKEGAAHVPGTDDLRGIELGKLCDIMAVSGACIGTSSFPLHLANACGCKTIVFTDATYQKSIHGTNRERYEKLWRMTPAPVCVIDAYGWKPPVYVVLDNIRSVMCE